MCEESMSSSFVGFEKQQLVRCRILAELCRRRFPGAGGWSHCGAQCGTEPTSLALLALYSYPSGSTATKEELVPLLAFQQPNGLWPAVADRVADVNFWALGVNTLMALGATPKAVGASLDALVHCRPREVMACPLACRIHEGTVICQPRPTNPAGQDDPVARLTGTAATLLLRG